MWEGVEQEVRLRILMLEIPKEEYGEEIQFVQ
jgi:hypothetical protein